MRRDGRAADGSSALSAARGDRRDRPARTVESIRASELSWTSWLVWANGGCTTRTMCLLTNTLRSVITKEKSFGIGGARMSLLMSCHGWAACHRSQNSHNGPTPERDRPSSVNPGGRPHVSHTFALPPFRLDDAWRYANFTGVWKNSVARRCPPHIARSLSLDCFAQSPARRASPPASERLGPGRLLRVE